MGGSSSIGVKMINKMLEDKIITKYRLAKEMGVTYNTINSWVRGEYFNEAIRLPRLIEVREKFMRMKGIGIYQGIHGVL